MALRMLLLRSKLEKAKKDLEALRGKDAGFAAREAELEEALNEVTDETLEEDRIEIENQVNAFQEEKDQHEEAKRELEGEIEKIEKDMGEETRKAASAIEKPKKKEGNNSNMKNRTKFFGMTIEERSAFFAREEVKNFLGQVRTCIREKRALTNVGLVIPEVMLELLEQKVEETSKLLKRVNLEPVSGTARQRIMGSIPEAIWTEMCAKLNELSLGFYDVEVDGYKVGGFFAVCNAVLEDNDVALASKILNALGKAIGKALDKAIVYGTGTKMPLGIVTRLAQVAEPSGYPATSRPWEDLHTSHMITGTGASGIKLFQEIVSASGVIDNDYSETGLVWLMNRKTHTALTVQSMEKNLNAAIVAGISSSMPVVGGEIIELPFIPDNNIVFGFMDMYLLTQRAGTQLGQSEHYRFVEDQTIFKGTARYDGIPVIPEAFAVMTITADAPASSVTFPADTANAG